MADRGLSLCRRFLGATCNRRLEDVTSPIEERTRSAVLFWSIARIVLGIAQMTGAIASAALLFQIGARRETVIAVSSTMIITLVSMLLFRVLKVQGCEPK